MHRLDIALLGPPAITLDGNPVETDRHKAIGLLAYLAAEAKPHNREALAALLWPEYPRASAFAYLRRTLWELNRILGKGWIEAGRDQVVLAHQPGIDIDMQTFQSYLDSSTDQITALTEAIKLYRGEFLENLVIADTPPFEEWQTQQAAYYRREYGRLLEKLVTAYERNGEFEQALPHARHWLTLDRLNENAYRAIMRQLAGMGDRSEAIRVYQTCVQTLSNELSLEPQAETEQLYQSILHADQRQGIPTPIAPVPLTRKPRITGYLPSPSTPFIGRRDEIDQVLKLTCDPAIYLLTLVGPGGTGKTRLSIQAAGEMLGSFQDGVWFIPLAAVQSVQGLILAISKGLSFQFFNGEEQPRQQLLDYLREKQLLLVLDNFEHLVEDGRELIADILGAGKGIKLLITSRQRLNLQAEQVYHVPGMRIPDPSIINNWDNPAEQAKAYSAIELLVERARRVKPEFQLTRENLPAVTQICDLVDGSPLGIILAGAWLELLTPKEIVNEIKRSLDFLESSAADIPERQRSLRAVFNSSWKLLDDLQQKAIQRLCVFRGNFSRQAAQEVSGCSTRTLLNLANKSWLLQAGDGRYLLHDLMRQFGMEHLQADQNDWREIKDRHAEYFIKFMQVQEQALQTSEQIAALEAIKNELDSNIPDAWEWLISNHQIEFLIGRMLPGLFHYWLIRSGSMEFIGMVKHARKAVPDSSDRTIQIQKAILESVEICFEMIAEIYDDQPKERLERLWERVNELGIADAMGLWYSVLVNTYGNTINYELGSQGYGTYLQKINNFSNPWEQGYGYLSASQFYRIDQPEMRKKSVTDALAIFEKIGVVHELGVCYRILGQEFAMEMDYEQAIAYTQAARGYFEQVEDIWSVDRTWMNLADYYIYSGNIEQAFHAFEVNKRINEKTGNRRMIGLDLSWESLATSRYGSLDEALELRKKSLEVAAEVGNQSDIAWHTWELGEIYRLRGDVQHAKEYYQQAYPQFEALQDALGLGFNHRGYGDIALMLGNWAQARQEFEAALQQQEKEQRHFRLWGLIYYHVKLAIALVNLGEYEAAREQLKASLSIGNSWPYPDLKAMPLTGIAVLKAATGKPGEAIEIAACVAKHPTTWKELKEQARRILQAASEELPADEALRCKEQGEGVSTGAMWREYLENPGLLEGD